MSKPSTDTRTSAKPAAPPQAPSSNPAPQPAPPKPPARPPSNSDSESKAPPEAQATGNDDSGDGSDDGGVHGLFTIAGRVDAPASCTLAQPDFAAQLANGNVIFRIPTPTFGAGLIENLDESTLLTNQAANLNNNFGISGTFNHNGNDGTISRFGWKAQNKSLEIFAGEAYNVEMGITNMLFPNERGVDSMNDQTNCNSFDSPNDTANLNSSGMAEFDDVSMFSAFMRFLAPPARGQINNPVVNGSNTFTNIGCALCHTVTLQTGPSQFAALSNQTINAYSDFALHHGFEPR